MDFTHTIIMNIEPGEKTEILEDMIHSDHFPTNIISRRLNVPILDVCRAFEISLEQIEWGFDCHQLNMLTNELALQQLSMQTTAGRMIVAWHLALAGLQLAKTKTRPRSFSFKEFFLGIILDIIQRNY